MRLSQLAPPTARGLPGPSQWITGLLVHALLALSPAAYAADGAATACRYDVRFGDPVHVLNVTIACNDTNIDGFELMAAPAVPWVENFTLADGREVAAQDGHWTLPADMQQPLHASYRLNLAALAEAEGNYDTALAVGGSILADPGAWLMVPTNIANPSLGIAFHPEGRSDAATAMPLSGGLHHISRDEIRFAGPTVFGQFDRRLIELPSSSMTMAGSASSQPAPAEAQLDLVLLDRQTAAGNASLAAWVRDTALAVAGFWGGFPVQQAMVVLVPVPGRTGVPFGRVLNRAGITTMILVGSDATARSLYDEWVLVHEFTHLGSPYIRDTGAWLNEGIATYIEPIVRYRAGWRSAESVWREWHDNMSRGLKALSSTGLAQTGRAGIYWGGALFLMLADIELRRDSNGRIGVEDGLMALRAEDGDISRTATTSDALAIMDRALGGNVLIRLSERYLKAGPPPDLDGLWRDLGVAESVDGKISFDDAAPLAAVRESILIGAPNSGSTTIPITLPDLNDIPEQ